ncbi:MAG: response regulator [Thermodesulfobacteriota bacterium]|nr:response regulator [Thermodesulfobacteriota bacterium]
MANILIIDKNSDYREILAVLMGNRGYAVTVLESGHQIIDMLGRTAFDIVFLDSETGGIRDKELVSQIRKKCPNCYIILISSKRGDDFVKDAMDNGAYGCVSKPFNPDEVLIMVNHIIHCSKCSEIEI